MKIRLASLLSAIALLALPMTVSAVQAAAKAEVMKVKLAAPAHPCAHGISASLHVIASI